MPKPQHILDQLSINNDVSRRQFLRISVTGVLGLATVGLLTACDTDTDDDPDEIGDSGADEILDSDDEDADDQDPGEPGQDELADDQVLRFPWLGVDTLDVMITQQYTLTLTRMLHDPLIYFDPDEGENMPMMAESWEVSDDLLSYTFHLREGAVWTDGTPVTASDFEYAIKRVLDPTTGATGPGAFYFIRGAEEFNTGESTDPDTVEIRSTDDVTLEVQQKEPFVWTISNFARADAMAAPRWIIEEHGDRWTDPEVTASNGRWKLESWLLDQEITMVRNEDYWGEKPTLERIVVNLSAGQTDAGALAAYDTDEVDATWVEASEIDRVEGDSELSEQLIRHPYPQSQIDFIVFNTARDDLPIGDARIRRALYLAIDYDQYFSQVRKGLSFPVGGGIIPEGILGHNPDAMPTGGVEEAQRLLAEAGYPDGEGFPGFTIRTSLDVGTYGLDGQTFQAMWQQNLGIEVDIELMEGTAFRSFRNSLVDPNADFEAYFTGTGGFDPTDWHSDVLTIFGGPRWEHPEFDALVAEASQEPDPDRRHELHAEADAIFMQEMPVLPYRVNGRGCLVKPWVRNFDEWPQASPRPFRKDIYIVRH